MKKIKLLIILGLILIGCGGNDRENINEKKSINTVLKLNTSEFGVLVNATVNIYELDGKNKKILFTETTSMGNNINNIGRFNPHVHELDDNKLYIYETIGGERYPIKDNLIDNSRIATPNIGIFHLFIKGKDIKKTKKIHITVLSEIIYQKMLPSLGLSTSQIDNKLGYFLRRIISKDINGDGLVNVLDMLHYHPMNNKTNLSSYYQKYIDKMSKNILEGKAFDFNIDSSSTNTNTSTSTNTNNLNNSLSEATIQEALDDGNYDYVIGQLINNRATYSDMSDDKINMNIAGAYVGKSGYTVFDITGAMASSNSNNRLNGFIFDVTKDNDALSTLKSLNKADNYYSSIINGLNCTDTTGFTDEQESSCFNLGLVRLTSLSNSVKLLFGGESQTVKKWAEGVDINSSEDLNGNGVVDSSDASACAIVYANNPNDNCRNGSMFTYRGKVLFNRSGLEHKTTLIEVDVGSAEHGYSTFYKLLTNKSTDNSPLLTNGICDKNFNTTTQEADGGNYFPCPIVDENGVLMNIKDSLLLSDNIQNLFPTGSATKTTVEGYINNITGSKEGVITQNNLSDYLRTH